MTEQIEKDLQQKFGGVQIVLGGLLEKFTPSFFRPLILREATESDIETLKESMPPSHMLTVVRGDQSWSQAVADLDFNVIGCDLISEPIVPPEVSKELESVFRVVEVLRSENGCPWDREQTHESLKPYLIEETYEVLDAIDSGNHEKLKEELGDLLLQVAMHAQIAKDEHKFNAADVSKAVAEKMVKRHPHVFGVVKLSSSTEVLHNWERFKGGETKQAVEGALDRVTPSLPALAYALGLQKRAARVGLEYRIEHLDQRIEKLVSELKSELSEDKLGELLFSIVDLARVLKLNPEEALRKKAKEFKQAYKRLLDLLDQAEVDPTSVDPQKLQHLWEQALSGKL